MNRAFSEIYKRSGNSVIAYREVESCDEKSLQEIADGSFTYLGKVFDEADFFVSNSTKRGMLKNTGKFLGILTSLGGSYMLEIHNKHLADMHDAIYKLAFDRFRKVEQDSRRSLSIIAGQLSKLNDLLKPVKKILQHKATGTLINRCCLTQLNKFNTGFNTSMNIGFGGLIGGSAALGAWGVVLLVGSASTGTAISSLSGIAATNATLAWFGGGSLAAGGAGMAGGFWVLGGIVAAPMVFFSTKNAYEKVDAVKLQKEKLLKETNKIIGLTAQASIQLQEVRKQEQKIISIINLYIPKITKELEQYKRHHSWVKHLFRREMSSQQTEAINNLDSLISEMLEQLGFKSNKDVPQSFA